MDKEAEKIDGFLEDLASDISQYGLTESIKESAIAVFHQIVDELGYRKLPKEKPPIIDKEHNMYAREAERLRLQFNQGIFTYRGAIIEACGKAEAFKEGTEAQREADIKHYEG